MADKEELNKEVGETVAALDSVATAQQALVASIGTLITEMTAAISRLLQKIATGTDYQSEVDQLNAIQAKAVALQEQANGTKANVESAIAQAQVEGN